MSEYKHGAYGALGDSVVRAADTAETVPVYIGTAPVNLVRGWREAAPVNVPVRISSLAEARAAIGQSDDWAAYTLCEVVAAHYDSGTEGVGPIYLINVLDPARHKATKKATATLSLASGSASIASRSIILDSLSLSRPGDDGSTPLAEGEDYLVSYDFANGRAVISPADKAEPLEGEVAASWEEVDPSKVTAQDIAGSDAGPAPTGACAVRLVYQEHFAVPNLLAAPGWSETPEVYRALVEAATKINGHWDAFVMADLSLADRSKAVDTIPAAIAWKEANGYASERSAVFWPHAPDAQGREFHLSTLAVAEALRADAANDGVPFASWSNRPVPVVRQRFAEGSPVRGFDQQEANALNARGITTAVGWAGEWVLWGPHTAAYANGGSSDPRAAFATGIRMLFHLTNGFQRRWASAIDGPMTRQLRDRIVNSEQEQLDALVAQGALVGSPRILFEAASNPDSSLAGGDFLWEVAATPSTPLKSATVRVSYTDEGLSAYLEGDE